MLFSDGSLKPWYASGTVTLPKGVKHEEHKARGQDRKGPRLKPDAGKGRPERDYHLIAEPGAQRSVNSISTPSLPMAR